MSSDNELAQNPSGDGVERRAAVREKAQRVTARQQRNRWLVRATLILVIAAVVAAATIYVVTVLVPSSMRPVADPVNMDDDSITLSADDDLSALVDIEEATTASVAEGIDERVTVTVDVYVDYQSQASSEFEAANAQQLNEWVRQGVAEVNYHPVALQTSQSTGTRYSLRAAGAVACVRSLAPEYAAAYNHELLLDAPAPDTAGFTDDELADRAAAVGVANPDDVRACIEDETYLTWANETTQELLAAPLLGSEDVALVTAPTVLVDGRAYTGNAGSAEEFAQFALTVSSENYYESPSPEPTESE